MVTSRLASVALYWSVFDAEFIHSLITLLISRAPTAYRFNIGNFNSIIYCPIVTTSDKEITFTGKNQIMRLKIYGLGQIENYSNIDSFTFLHLPATLN